MYPNGNYPLTVQQIEESLKTRWKPTVVMHNDIVVGYSNFYGYEEGELCWLGNFVVSSLFRGKGAAEFLIKSMMRIAKDELKVPLLQLGCHSTNIRGLLFYSKLKFKPIDLFKVVGYQGQIAVAIEMRVDLTNEDNY